MVDKLNIHSEMQALDHKDRGFYDDLTEDERKKFSPFLMIRWGSAVQGSRELQEYYVVATNERLNKHFFTVNRHPKLQWLMATSVSPDMGAHRHTWIAPKKKDKTTKSRALDKQLMSLFPNMKTEDAKVLASLVTQDDIDQYMRDRSS